MLKRHIYLILAVLFMALTVGAQYYFFGNGNTDLYVSQVKERLALASDEADDQIFHIKERFKAYEYIDFGALLEECKYPTFIYRIIDKKSKLVFWSDHTHPVDYYDLITGDVRPDDNDDGRQYNRHYFVEKCIETDHERSMYLAKKSWLRIRNQDYEIVALIPLRKRYQVEAKFLQQTLNPEIFPPSTQVRVVRSRGGGVAIENKYGIYLFSMFFPDNFTYHTEARWVVLILGSIALLLLGIQFTFYLRGLLNRGWAGRATALLAATLIAVRAIMLYFEIPYHYIELSLFAPNNFASSAISPSLGDLLLNVLAAIGIGAFAFTHYPRIIRYRYLLPLNDLGKTAFTSLWVGLSYLSLYAIYFSLENMFAHSIYSKETIYLDITANVTEYYPEKIVSFMIFMLTATAYFFVSHITGRMLLKLANSVYDAPIRFVAGSLGYYLLSLALGIDNLVIFNANAVYLIFITFLTLPLHLRRIDYTTYIYLFAWAIVSSSIGAYSIYKFHGVRDLENKQKFATQLLLENDEIAEYYLSKLKTRLKQEDNIAYLLGQGNHTQLIDQIRKSYLNTYFDKYDIDIQLYNSQHEPLGNTRRTYQAEREDYAKDKYAVYFNVQRVTDDRAKIEEMKEIFFIDNMIAGKKMYVVFIGIERDGSHVGDIVLRLNARLLYSNTAQDNTSFLIRGDGRAVDEQSYSYAYYSKEEKLIYSTGTFTYNDKFLQQFKHPSGFFIDDLRTEGYHHLYVPNSEKQHIIISTPEYVGDRIFTNFSYLFLLMILVLMLVLIGHNLFFRSEENRLNFNAKIQIYLNFAFFLPLVVVSIIIISILGSANVEEAKAYYLELAQHISSDMRGRLDEAKNNSAEMEEVRNKLSEIANVTQADITLFDSTGVLMGSSQAHVYEHEWLSEQVNPHAYSLIKEKNHSWAFGQEHLGALDFNAVYVSIRSLQDNSILGILGIPFSDTRYQYEKQTLEVLSNIVQVFTVLLILLLALSYISARSLTAPLRLIRQKLRRVSFQNNNEPIEYHSDDEIGLLVSEYNKMLLKLEASRDALSQSEKESAWREMAKQVAHEIKNPLTPIRLNLQQLQRVLDKANKPAHRSIETLLGQVETLSDIATSFAAFARMPSLKEEPIDLAEVVRETVHLHEYKEGEKIELHGPEQAVYPIMGDPKLLGRIFTNLIINGLQAVPDGKGGEMHIYMKQLGQSVRIEFRDNGDGIPAHIQSKIFMPNFTTKSSGSGIGLAIAKRGIEQLGGSIWFETEPGVGTSFFIELPLRSNEHLSA